MCYEMIITQPENTLLINIYVTVENFLKKQPVRRCTVQLL